jgi:hypothetical protein
MSHTRTPDLMPVLSRGKHRNPRKGACFMELASYLAGEPWSDHPRCTHPLLATLAREVNDHVSDASRVWLAPLIPEVIGLTSDDPRADAWIARQVALTALPLVSAEKQGVAAVALFLCERHLASTEGREGTPLSPEVAAALDDVPRARDWAEEYLTMSLWPAGDFRLRSAPRIVHSAVWGIAGAAIPDVDTVLIDLLQRVITSCHEWFHLPSEPVAEFKWRQVCTLTVS